MEVTAGSPVAGHADITGVSSEAGDAVEEADIDGANQNINSQPVYNKEFTSHHEDVQDRNVPGTQDSDADRITDDEPGASTQPCGQEPGENSLGYITVPNQYGSIYNEEHVSDSPDLGHRQITEGVTAHYTDCTVVMDERQHGENVNDSLAGGYSTDDRSSVSSTPSDPDGRYKDFCEATTLKIRRDENLCPGGNCGKEGQRETETVQARDIEVVVRGVTPSEDDISPVRSANSPEPPPVPHLVRPVRRNRLVTMKTPNTTIRRKLVFIIAGIVVVAVLLVITVILVVVLGRNRDNAAAGADQRE